MSRKIVGWLRERREEERRRLAAGERAKAVLSSRIQRTAARGLAGFFVLMLVFTLLSRSAEGVTVPRVTTDTPKTGILTQRVNLSGALEPQGDLALILPEGVEVTRIAAAEGQRVQAGDVLLELDADALAAAVEKLEGQIRILDLKLKNAAQGNSGASANALVEAQKALEEAREDYRRLEESRARSEDRGREDLDEAQARYDQARTDLEEAGRRAKEELVKAAAENLETVKESAEDAISSAQSAVDSAEEAESAADAQYDRAVSALNRAKTRLKEAEQALEEAQESGDEEAAQAARAEVDAAQSEVDAAQDAVDGMYHSGGSSRQARANLKKVKEKWEKKIKEAETKLEEAKAKTDVSEEPLVVSAQSALDGAEQALKSARRAVEDGGLETESQLLAAQRAVERAQRGVDEAERAAAQARREDQNTRLQAEIDRLGYQSERQELAEQLAALKGAAAAGGKLTAPIAGTVQSILAETGKIKAGDKAAVLSRSDQGFLFTAELDQKQAEKLAVGDRGTLSYTQDGKSRQVEAVISALGAPNDKGMVKVTALLPQGSYPAGASGDLEISRRSEQYRTVLPLGAVRSDANGDYVLAVRETKTVMGAEQTLSKVPVKVLDQDSQQAAVESDGLMYDDSVVTSASKPVAEGDRVRLEQGQAGA